MTHSGTATTARDEQSRASAALKEGRFADARAHLDKALTAQPRNFALRASMVRTLMLCGEHDRARELLNTLASEADREPPELALCTDLLVQGQHFSEALDVFQRLEKRGVRNAAYNIATCLMALGRLREAEERLEQALVTNPADGQAHHVLSTLKRVTPDTHHLDRLHGLLTRGDLAAMTEVQLHYAAGKELEDLGEFDDAFSHFASGAALRRERLNYDVAGDVAALQEIEKVFCDAPWVNKIGEESASEGAEMVFVFGLPRSGTTLADRILSAHSDCDSLGEITDLPLSLVSLAGRAVPKLELVGLSNTFSPAALAETYLGRIQTLDAKTPRLIDKTPMNFLYAALIARALPGAAMIWMDRHPLDACFAMFKTLFQMGYPFSYSLSDIGEYYIAYARLRRRWLEILEGHIRFQSYERLVENFDTESRALVTAAGLGWQQSCADFHRNTSTSVTASAAQVREPLYTRAVGHWKHYASHLQPLIQRLNDAELL